MDPFLKTCLTQVALLVALSLPILIGGCERQSDPPVEPMSAVPSVKQDPGNPGSTPAAVRVDDAAVTARVKTALLADDDVKGFAIDVDTKDGRVTLKGALPSDEQVQRAIEVARAVEGVQSVINRLTVTAEDKAARSTQG